jgi:hypothetical protein
MDDGEDAKLDHRLAALLAADVVGSMQSYPPL